MIVRQRLGCAIRHALGCSLLLPVGLVACSNSPATPPDAFVAATLGPAPDKAHNNENQCLYGNPHSEVSVGTAASKPTTVTDGDSQAGEGVTVRCTVSGGSTSYINLTISIAGDTTGGTLNAVGNLGSSNIVGDLVNANDGEFIDQNCTVSFTYRGQMISSNVSPGQIWAHLSCPNMVSQGGHSVVFSDNTQAIETCDGEADFLFENCSH